ncbi:unnamed protein product (macronuclear) [Paramecium tetraurelia]|uniref:Uncharacterized protein n=1 Tax=Paramecium tetraurelia TaxID=5888 RepID=A0D1A9_PARTE|nr:uncharacterized protein GSPATT00012350001 [Paramecium tetraurelia]CAK76826.1 unnamed protein product [Paramecium tetraurelia]|eukprot:XP_001444223.1 hypothetical protein (macronuclear) [Paramecium tetraurelia strain d4-2]
MQETKTHLKGLRTVIAQKKERMSHNYQHSIINGSFLIEGTKVINQFEYQKESEAKMPTKNKFQNLFRYHRLSLKNEKQEKLLSTAQNTRKNFTQQRPSVLNVEFSIDQNIARNKSIEMNQIRRPQRIKQRKKDAELNERDRFYTVQFITKSEGKYENRNLLELNVLKYQKLSHSPKFGNRHPMKNIKLNEKMKKEKNQNILLQGLL